MSTLRALLISVIITLLGVSSAFAGALEWSAFYCPSLFGEAASKEDRLFEAYRKALAVRRTEVSAEEFSRDLDAWSEDRKRFRTVTVRTPSYDFITDVMRTVRRGSFPDGSLLDSNAFRQRVEDYGKKMRAEIVEIESAVEGSIRRSEKLREMDVEGRQGHHSRVTAIDTDAEGKRVVSGAADGTVHIWSVDGKTPETLLETGTSVREVRVKADGTQAITVHHDGRAILWDLSLGKKIYTFESGEDPVGAIATDENFTTLTLGTTARLFSNVPGKVFVWDLKTGEEIARFDSYVEGSVNAVDPDPFSSRLLLGSDAQVVIFDRATKKELFRTGGLRPEQGKPGPSYRTAEKFFRPRRNRDFSRVLTCTSDGKRTLWDMAEKRPIAEFSQWANGSFEGADPDLSRGVFAKNDGSIEVADLTSGKTLWSAKIGNRVRISKVDFTPDFGRILGACDDGRIRVWETKTGTLLKTIGDSTDPNQDVESVYARFSADGKRIVRGKKDGSVEVWNWEFIESR